MAHDTEVAVIPPTQPVARSAAAEGMCAHRSALGLDMPTQLQQLADEVIE
jgi:hypothetical protein